MREKIEALNGKKFAGNRLDVVALINELIKQHGYTYVGNVQGSKTGVIKDGRDDLIVGYESYVKLQKESGTHHNEEVQLGKNEKSETIHAVVTQVGKIEYRNAINTGR